MRRQAYDKILLINDNSAHINWGAQASPPSLVSILTEALPGGAVTTLPHEWLTRSYRLMYTCFGESLIRADKWRGVRPILHRCSVHVPFFPEVADDFDYWADEWVAGRGGPQAKEFLELANEANIIIYNGENSIYRNTTEGCHGIFLLYLTKTRLKKPSCIVNHTAHLNDVRPIMSGMVKLVYPLLDLVAVREPCSLKNLQGLGIGKAELYPDVVFSQNPKDHSRDCFDTWYRANGLQHQKYFCLSASGLPVSEPRGPWDGEVKALVRELKSLGHQAVLVAKDPWCQFLREVAARTGSIFFGPEHGFPELWPLFENASFLVTGHYHYVIFSSMVGCPFIPMTANNHKMRGVCEHLEWHRAEPFDVTALRTCRAEIVEEARRIVDERERLSRHLIERSLGLRAEARRLGVRVAEVVRLHNAVFRGDR